MYKNMQKQSKNAINSKKTKTLTITGE